MKSTLAIVFSFFAVSQIASAHATGHEGNVASTAQHFLTQPDHLAVLGGLGLLVGLAAWKLATLRKS